MKTTWQNRAWPGCSPLYLPCTSLHSQNLCGGFAYEWYDKRILERADKYVQLWGGCCEIVCRWERGRCRVWICVSESVFWWGLHLCAQWATQSGDSFPEPSDIRARRSRSPAQPDHLVLTPSQSLCVFVRTSFTTHSMGFQHIHGEFITLATSRLKDDESCQRLLISLQLSNMNNGRWDWVT